jgi:hypothetical protein
MKTYKFTELSPEAQNVAIDEYLSGWYETHDENDLTYSEAKVVLALNIEEDYLEDGTFV